MTLNVLVGGVTNSTKFSEKIPRYDLPVYRCLEICFEGTKVMGGAVM
jgi:hypothetical protein